MGWGDAFCGELRGGNPPPRPVGVVGLLAKEELPEENKGERHRYSFDLKCPQVSRAWKMADHGHFTDQQIHAWMCS